MNINQLGIINTNNVKKKPIGYYIYMIENRVAIVMGIKKIEKRDITKLTNIDRHVLNKIYKGEINSISLKNLNSLCYALDCTASDLFRYIPDEG